jgi:hypothetical protein
MVNRTATYAALLLLLPVFHARGGDITAAISVSDGRTVLVLHVGVRPGATPGYDPILDSVAPPPPPVGAFDARTRFGVDEYTAEYRDTSSAETPFELRWQSADGGPVTLRWDPSLPGSPPGTGWYITDRFGGGAFRLDMRRASVLSSSAHPLLAHGAAVRMVRISTGGTAAEPELPEATALHQNYPNPFNPSTDIRFDLAAPGRVTIRAISPLGETVDVILDEHRPAGRFIVRWSPRDLASGAYFLELRSGSSSAVRKVLLLR